MIKVYFEHLGSNGTSVSSDLVAVFDDEKTYEACAHALRRKARKEGMVVTESFHDDVRNLFNAIDKKD